ncbi:MAG: response regulator [Patescibacteria group bacterium]|nr:response regulator [Patescibacteria group bacterium]
MEKKKILVVEDDAFLRRAYKAKLGKGEYEIIEAVDGDDAIKKVKETMPDVIILDLIMPKKDGFQFLNELSKQKVKKVIPIFVVSNLGQETDIKEAEKYGVKKYFVKSDTSIAEVANTVSDFLKK